MSTRQITLGSADQLTVLYSYPNVAYPPKNFAAPTLAATIEHWFRQTLARDGLAGAQASVSVTGKTYTLTLTGPDAIAPKFAIYAKRLPSFLANGWDAWTNVVPQLRSTKRWDPCPTGSTPPYLPWRFFLPHGMAMVNQKALLFFHYPPIRLLETNQDYLNDPVPVRCEELLTANGVPDGDLMLFNTVMDATPIGATDDQGSKAACQPANGGCAKCAFAPNFGLIPIQLFHEYQKAQVALLLNASATKPGFTVPIVVYGAHPLATFNTIFGTKLKSYQTTVANIVPGLKTPVLASTHPFTFYIRAQGSMADVGSSKLVNIAAATTQMKSDLAVARWLKAMSDDPSQDANAVWNAAVSFWNAPAQAATRNALVQHQGSLWYYQRPALDFKFKVPLASSAPAATTTTTRSPQSAKTSRTPAATAPTPPTATRAKPSPASVIGAKLAAKVTARAAAR